MIKAEGVVVMGDSHGQWNVLNRFMRDNKSSVIFQCGDFGYWPNYWDLSLKKIKNKYHDCTIYFCDGNHEDHWALRGKWAKNNYKLEPIELKKNIFWMPRGSTLELEDGRVVMFMGGADSVDKHTRTPGVDWFPDELISQRDLELALGNSSKADVIISHTNPKEFIFDIDNIYGRKHDDPSQEALSVLLEQYKPDLWFFGHYHQYTEGQYKNTKWYTLDTEGYNAWVMNLPTK